MDTQRFIQTLEFWNLDASSHFTDMTRVPGGEGVSIGVAMREREVWLKCHRSHAMISDDETEALWIAEKALESSVLTPADRGWGKIEAP